MGYDCKPTTRLLYLADKTARRKSLLSLTLDQYLELVGATLVDLELALVDTRGNRLQILPYQHWPGHNNKPTDNKRVSLLGPETKAAIKSEGKKLFQEHSCPLLPSKCDTLQNL